MNSIPTNWEGLIAPILVDWGFAIIYGFGYLNTLTCVWWGFLSVFTSGALAYSLRRGESCG